MSVIYSIPVKPIKNNGAFKCTIPKEIVTKTGINKNDKIVWILHDDGKIEVKVEK